MAKSSYNGPHASVFAEGYMQGVEDGARSAKSEMAARAGGDLTDGDIKKLNSGSARAVPLVESANPELDLAFGMVQSNPGAIVRGAIQTFGELVVAKQ